MSIIFAHVQGCQDRATQLHGIICAIEHLDTNDASEEGISALIQTARGISRRLREDLDIVNLPKPVTGLSTGQSFSNRSDTLHQAVTLKYLIENAANLDNESCGDELTTILGVLSAKAAALVDTLDAPHAVAAE